MLRDGDSDNQVGISNPPVTGSSSCGSAYETPLPWAWCQLSALSSGLQSVQIIIIGALAIGALVKTTIFVRTKSRKLSAGCIEKKIISVENSRLTATALGKDGECFTAGFSGVVFLMTNKYRVKRLNQANMGLVRSLLYFNNHDVVLAGTEDGTLYAFPNGASAPIKVAAFGSSIFSMSAVDMSDFYIGLGSGDVAHCTLSRSPAQDEVVIRELRRIKCHSGKAFDVIVSDDNHALTVGEGGELLCIEKTRNDSISFRIKASSETIWSVAEKEKGVYILGLNDGSLELVSENGSIRRASIHTSSVRHIFLSPRKRWCFSVGKDRCLYAVLPDLSDSVLLHRTRDYIYHGEIDSSGRRLIMCDGSGDVTILKFNKPIDDLDISHLRLAGNP